MVKRSALTQAFCMLSVVPLYAVGQRAPSGLQDQMLVLGAPRAVLHRPGVAAVCVPLGVGHGSGVRRLLGRGNFESAQMLC